MTLKFEYLHLTCKFCIGIVLSQNISRIKYFISLKYKTHCRYVAVFF